MNEGRVSIGFDSRPSSEQTPTPASEKPSVGKKVDVSGTHVAFCFGYQPKSVYKQSIYSALIGRGGLLSKTGISEQEIQLLYADAQDSGLFVPTGRELKCLINREFSEEEFEMLLSWLTRLTKEIQKHGLKGQDENIEPDPSNHQ